MKFTGFELNSIKKIKQVMKHDICFSSTEGMIQEPRFHGQIFCTSSKQILKPKIKNWGMYYLTWIDYHHWKLPHWFSPEAKAASWFAKRHPKQFNNKCPLIGCYYSFPTLSWIYQCLTKPKVCDTFWNKFGKKLNLMSHSTTKKASQHPSNINL